MGTQKQQPKQLVKQQPILECSTSLPFITDELYEEFGETSLMSFDLGKGRPTWTQVAVEFACCLKIECKGR